MTDISQQIEDIQAEIRKTPHHKGTNRFIGLMRAKIARLRDREIESSSKGGGGGGGFNVKKQGDATVVLVGPPSSGKSTLINVLTNAESKVASYAFTTVNVIPGMLKHNEAYIQILDIPGLIEGAVTGKGRGREVLSVARSADLLLVMTDVDRVGLLEKMMKELEGAGIRINQTKPNALIDKKVSGGLYIHTNLKQEIDKESIKEIAREFGIKNGDITIKEKLSYDRLFDTFSANRVYIPAIFAVNKIDEAKGTKRNPGYIYFSAQENIGINELINSIWKALKFITVYLVKPDADPDSSNPIIMKQGQTLQDLAVKIGTDFAETKKLAKIWGSAARFPGQEVSLTTPIKEGMMIRFL